MWNKVKTFVSEHPWGTAGIVFVIGVILIYLFWPRSSGTATATQDLSPYYNAQGAAVAAGASVYGAQIAANAQTAVAVKNADTAVQLATISAGVQNHQYDTTLDTIKTQTAAELAAYLNNNRTTVDLTKIQADTTRDATAAALTLGSKALDERFNEVNNNNYYSYAGKLSDNATSVSNVAKGFDSANYKAGLDYNLGSYKAGLDYNLGSSLAYYDYVKHTNDNATLDAVSRVNADTIRNADYYKFMTAHEGLVTAQVLGQFAAFAPTSQINADYLRAAQGR